MENTYTEEDCIKALKECKKRIGVSPSVEQYKREDISPSWRTIHERFDAWDNAKEEANLESRHWYDSWVNQKYFRNIDSGEKAYWLGFIFGDGSMYESTEGNYFELGISVKDKSHLVNFKSDIESKHKLKAKSSESSYPGKPQIVLSIGQEEFADNLIDKNVTETKLTDGTLPDINDEMKPHFIRGLYDADGNYHKSESTRGRWRICGSCRERLVKIQPWLPVESQIYRDKDGYQLTVTGKDKLDKLHEWIYPEGCLTSPLLGRKFYLKSDDIE